MHGGALIRRWTCSPLGRFSLATVLGWTLLLAALTDLRYGADPRAFLCLGERMPHPPALAGVPRTSPWGYDGQFYATLATDPLLLKADTVRGLDNPAYRARRVLVPLLAWTLAGGRSGAALVAYQLLCWAGGIWLVVLIAAWLGGTSDSIWWAGLLAASGGLVTSMIRCTPDAFAVAAMITAVALYRRDRRSAALALAVVATLTRETAVLGAAVLAWEEVRRRRWGGAVAFLAAPSALLGLWQWWLVALRGLHGSSGGGNLGPPGAGLVGKLGPLVSGRAEFSFMELLGALAVLASLAACAAWLYADDGERPALSLYLLWGGLALMLASPVYADGFAFSRVLLPLPALALLARAGETSRWRRRLLLIGPVTFAAMGLVMVKGEFAMAWPWLADLTRPLRAVFGWS